MENIREKITPVLRKKPIFAMVLCSIVFAASIFLLFAREKERLDMEYEGMISDSLNIHTRHNAVDIDQTIENAGRAIQTAETIFLLTARDKRRDFLEQRNAANPIYTIEYITREEMRADILSAFVQTDEEEAFRRLSQGETVVGDICYDESVAGYSFAVIVPLREDGVIIGAMYTRINADSLLPRVSESAVYQNVESSIITGDGNLIFNTFGSNQEGNLSDALGAYGLAHEDINRIENIIKSPDVDSSTFTRNGETYFVSAAKLRHNDWNLVSFVRGPDVLLRSATIFREVVRTSSIAIFITITVACLIFLQLLFSKRRLEEEQRRNHALMQRLQAMFDQHSALKVVIDAETKTVVDANPSTCNYFNVTREEVLGRAIQDFNLLPPHILKRQFQNISSSGALFFAAPHRLQNGEIKLLDVYASVIHDGGRELVYAILFDSTDREKYREELFREKELLRTTLQSIGDGVVTTDNQGLITSLNSVAEKLTGWTGAEAVGVPFTDVLILQNEATGEPVENPIQKVLDTGLIIGLANHTELKNRQGKCIPIADSAAPIKAEDGQAFGSVMVFRDVSDEKEHQRKIEFLSYHDFLTGLYNRRYLEETITRLESAGHLPVAVIMADVNGLKITNDVFGHKAGDGLLKNVADLMCNYCRAEDLIARWGGDEFVILMPGTGLEAAEAITREIKDAHIAIEDSNLTLSLSLGCACTDTADGSISIAMQQAEKYMYQQKLLSGKSYRNSIISTLLATLYEKSNETEEHSKRLEAYCHAIGRELQLSSKEMDELSLLALLHDIGKVGINPNILQKPGPLSFAEWEEIKRHPEIGYRIAQETPELAIVADLILSHHERWDGEGYPRGLREKEIPVACRILAVVDAFDAMTNDRVYRWAMTLPDALLEIEKNAGSKFDPQIAKLLIHIVIGEYGLMN